jgi:hypothetical protein
MASSNDSTATATSCTTATRQKTSILTSAFFHPLDRTTGEPSLFHNQAGLGG